MHVSTQIAHTTVPYCRHNELPNKGLRHTNKMKSFSNNWATFWKQQKRHVSCLPRRGMISTLPRN